MKKHRPEIKGIVDQAYDLVQKILKWRSMRLEKNLHIRYEPSQAVSQSHFEAIMGDVNEDVKKIEEFIKIQNISESLSTQMLNIEGLGDIDFSFDEKENQKIKADIEYKKRLKEQKEIQSHIISKTKK